MKEPIAHCPAACGVQDPFTCPLSRVVAGKTVRIKRLSASPEVNGRLRELGLCEEQTIKLLSRQSNLVCLVCNARLGISSELAEIILVEPLAAPKTACPEKVSL